MLLCDIVHNVVSKKLLTLKDAIKASSTNQLRYHNLENKIKVLWNKNGSVAGSEFIKIN